MLNSGSTRCHFADGCGVRARFRFIATRSSAGYGGHGESLRSNRGDAAEAQLGTSPVNRFDSEHGNPTRSRVSPASGGATRSRDSVVHPERGGNDWPVERIEQATAFAGEKVKAVKEADYDKRTPCIEFLVRDLLNHMIGGLATLREAAEGGKPRYRTATSSGRMPAQPTRNGGRSCSTRYGAMASSIATGRCRSDPSRAR